ncbi:hypothetical protein V8E36_000405 [Tilletia maclaganii]
MPLNRLEPRKATFPDAPDATLILRKFQFDPKSSAALEQAFGTQDHLPKPRTRDRVRDNNLLTLILAFGTAMPAQIASELRKILLAKNG